MLTPSAASLPGHRGERLGGDGPAQHHDDVGRGLPDDRQVVAALDGDVEAHLVNRGLDIAAQCGVLGDVRRHGHQ